LAEKPKSVSETYIRVAVIDIDTNAGIINIYRVGRGRCETLVPFVANSREEHTLARIADIRRGSTTSFRIDWKGIKYGSGLNT
jgi:hypothetical protein